MGIKSLNLVERQGCLEGNLVKRQGCLEEEGGQQNLPATKGQNQVKN
jgi:hypothetical protein